MTQEHGVCVRGGGDLSMQAAGATLMGGKDLGFCLCFKTITQAALRMCWRVQVESQLEISMDLTIVVGEED